MSIQILSPETNNAIVTPVPAATVTLRSDTRERETEISVRSEKVAFYILIIRLVVLVF